MDRKQTVLLTGGGTLGSVTPLLAIARAWRARDPEVSFIWVGTPDGPEARLVEREGIPFIPFNAPKAPRYLSWRWLTLPFELCRALWHAIRLLFEYQPAWILSAGAYVSVPLVWCAPFAGAKVAIHQLDVPLSLSNRLMLPMADLVTTTWSETAKSIKKPVHVVGSPVYDRGVSVRSREDILMHFDLDPTLGTVLVLGGGTGSVALNAMMESIAMDLAREANVIHVTGKDKRMFVTGHQPGNYRTFGLLEEDLMDALRVADVVVTRAGLGTMGELVLEGKAAIFVPLPHSPQVANARAVSDRSAGYVLEERTWTRELLLETIRKALEPHKRHELEERMAHLFPVKGVAETVVELVLAKEARGGKDVLKRLQ